MDETFKMDYASTSVSATVAKILCCQCGVAMEPNPANMCVSCLRIHVDITQDIPKQGTLQFCRNCERYLQPPFEWISCALESKELLGLCLRKLKALNKVKLVDAGFIWTEPHSKRIKVKLTVHGEVMSGMTLQQVFIVEFTVANQMCDECHRSEAQDYWRALVQVRQKSDNKKTFYYLEQLMLKHKAHQHTLSIKPEPNGLDFFYSTESQARKLVDFMSAVLPCRYQQSKKLLSHDIHSNVYNYKFTYSMEIVPVMKDSVVCLSKKMSQQLGGISPLCIVYRVTNSIKLIDPSTAQLAEVNSGAYWRDSFQSVFKSKQLTEYTVMDIEPIMEKDRVQFPGQGQISFKHMLADVWVVRSCDLGLTTDSIHCRTHLGHLLKPMDTVMGYAIADSNVNDSNFDKLSKTSLPDVILIKKSYPERRRKRNWKLKRMTTNTEINFENDNNDMDEFMDDLEEDKDLRQNINIYKNPDADIESATENDDEDEAPRISLEEMMEDLVIYEDDIMEVYD